MSSPGKAGTSPKATSPQAKSPKAASPGGGVNSPENTQEQPLIEAEPDATPDGDEDNSDYDSSGESDMTSLRSSIFDYKYENGRRYHAFRAGQYLLPNDETEQERLDIIHHIFRLSLDGRICFTELENPQSILDIGTGTGMWAIEMGDEFPSAEVIGTDLSPIQSEWVPPNVRFEIDDATNEWMFPKDHFDFIHARTLAGAIQDWPGLLRQCYEHCKPGGAVEIVEGRANFFCDDGTLGEDTQTYKWLMEFRRLSGPLGFDIAPSMPDLLRDAGFEDVQITQKVIPLGTWPKDKRLKEIGRWFKSQFLSMAIEAYSLALFTRAGGWEADQVQVLLAMVRNELRTNKIHLYTYSAFITGTKPATAS
ncbi:hypothetical protein NLU13_0241 [Sarocladium strictum]|uniref:S-adenosyl-L-methionine-dependent methyltransferase n=1 Tax=Sarocladium strictum TaxID=5046 RepID=A0AA39LB36_SARSR|nr:hypothetical protein NLU13_0241 [Sarocladium strictum]